MMIMLLRVSLSMRCKFVEVSGISFGVSMWK